MAKIKLLGTSHIAKESIQQIKNEMAKGPDIVAIELDIQRLPHLFSKKRRKAKLSDIIRMGFGGFLFNWIGSYLQKKLGAQVGLMPGSDMKQAIRAAKIAKADIFLIDQPIGITLKRLSSEIGVYEKLKLVFSLFGGFTIPAPKAGENSKNFLGPENQRFPQEIRNLDLRKVPDSKIIEFLLKELEKRFPKLHKVLVAERNEYMAKQLLTLAKLFPDKEILAVIGAGHIKGVSKLLNDRFFKSKALKEINGQSSRIRMVQIRPQ